MEYLPGIHWRRTLTQEPTWGNTRSMTFKLRHLIVLLFALVLGAAAMYVEMNPWLRILVAALLLIPVIYGADGLGIPKLMNVLPDPAVRHRQFGVLRSQVMQLLDLVRRLNWLRVDLERGVRNEDDVRTEIVQAEQRLDEILAEIRSVAGQPSPQVPAPEPEVDEKSEDFSPHQSAQEQL